MQILFSGRKRLRLFIFFRSTRERGSWFLRVGRLSIERSGHGAAIYVEYGKGRGRLDWRLRLTNGKREGA